MSDICGPALNDIWNNEIITQKSFHNNLKLADVTPVFKKDDASLLKNYAEADFRVYRQASISPLM